MRRADEQSMRTLLCCLVPFVVCALGIAGPASADVTHRWSFDELSAGKIPDLAGNADLTLRGTAALSGQDVDLAPSGASLRLDGAGYAEVELPDLNGEYTLMGWIRPTGPLQDPNDWRTPFGISGRVYFGQYASCLDGGLIAWESTSVYALHCLDDAQLTNVWRHVAQTWDGTTWKMFVDGELIASEHIPLALDANSDTFAVGDDVYQGYPSVGDYAFRGDIDEIVIRDDVLSPAAVAAVTDAVRDDESLTLQRTRSTRMPAFAAQASDDDAQVTCTIAGVSQPDCDAIDLTGRAPGPVTVAAVMTDRFGRTTTATEMVQVAPLGITALSGPVGTIGPDTSASWRFEESGASATCKLDGVVTPCSSDSVTLTGLSPGRHDLKVIARDVHGHLGESLTWSFVVTVPAPPSEPAAPSAQPTARPPAEASPEPRESAERAVSRITVPQSVPGAAEIDRRVRMAQRGCSTQGCRVRAGAKARPSLRIWLTRAEPMKVSITRRGKVLEQRTVTGRRGENRVVWTGRAKGRALPAGTYVVRIEVGGQGAWRTIRVS